MEHVCALITSKRYPASADAMINIGISGKRKSRGQGQAQALDKDDVEKLSRYDM